MRIVDLSGGDDKQLRVSHFNPIMGEYIRQQSSVSALSILDIYMACIL